MKADMHYDFVLFENQYNYEVHYKEVANFARQLKKAGYSVAIADVFKESHYCQVDGVPHIAFEKKAPEYFSDLRWAIEKKGILKKIKLRIQHSLYLRYVLKQIMPICDRLYMGALVYNTPLGIWPLFQKGKQFYFWGLRSYIVLQWKKSGLFSASGLISRFFYSNLQRQKNVNLICSNNAIKEEFEQEAHIAQDRLIVRPERTVQSVTVPTVRQDRKLRLLSIGSTRSTKNIHRILEALKLANNANVYYTIAGANFYEDEYERIIENAMGGVKNVVRINRSLSEQEYEYYLNDCDFMISCEGKQATNISSGTLMEALLHGKPVIGPNHNTYYDEIHGNGVGIVFDVDNIQSLADAINQAYRIGVEPYVENLIAYQEKFLEDKVVKDLKKQLEN